MVDVLASVPQQPDLSDKPDNTDFLNAVFRGKPEEYRPTVVSFAGSPSEGGKGKWFGRTWDGDTSFNPEHNNYFTLSVYAKDAVGVHRRKKANFKGLHAVMLDDIGTKVEVKEWVLPPSWSLETSPGNYQAGYLLESPITDAKDAERLINAFIAAGLCDRGANGPTARLARLPVGVNGKHQPPFACAMRIWAPDRRYTPEQLVEAYGLELDKKRQRTKKPPRVKSPARDEIFQPRPHDNPVLAALKTRGLYKALLEEGKHDITCPWHQEHTGAVDGGTGYFEPSDNYPLGGFNCFHSHGGSLSIHSLLNYLGVPASAARMRPSIRVLPGHAHRVVDYAEQVLADTGQYYHQAGAGIVTLVHDPVAGGMRLRAMNPHALMPALSAAAIWERPKGQDDHLPIDPPEKIVFSLANASTYRHLPHLIGMAHQPYLRPSGELVTRTGYDAESLLYGAFDTSSYRIPDEPTCEDAVEALSHLRGLVEEFPFAGEHDMSAALSAMLTAVLRPALPLAPMYHVQAPQIGTGKSFLCQLIAAMATAKRPTPTSFPQNDEECQKTLLAELLRAPAVIEFDNLTTDILPHKSLCTVLTSEAFMGRILGVSKTAEVGTRALFLSSGNNVGPVRDMARRCVTITLNPQRERPIERVFKRPNLMQEVYAARAEYVSNALTIVRAWVCAGRPETPCRNVASYGLWSEFCRQPLLWLGLPDPAHALFETMETDPDKETLGRLLDCWHRTFGSKPTMVRKAVEVSNNMEILDALGETSFREVLEEIAGGRNGIDPQQLGLWLKRHANRIVNNMRLVRVDGTRAALAWRVELVSSGQ